VFYDVKLIMRRRNSIVTKHVWNHLVIKRAYTTGISLETMAQIYAIVYLIAIQTWLTLYI